MRHACHRGLGLAFAKAAHALGASKVYAGMRNTEGFDVPGLTPVRLDVTDDASVRAAAAMCQDVTLVVNNAGIVSLMNGPLDQNMDELSRTLMETNYFGIIRVSQAFAPVLAANGGGAFINVLSDATWLSVPMLAAYAASKSAAWSVTNALRLQLKSQGTQVVALHVGFLDTDMTKGFDMPKSSPDLVARKVYAGLEAGALEVLADEGTVQVKSTLSSSELVYFDPPSF
ncbi:MULTISPECIES: SDR family oxidoreductase [unclassified Pseudomonas]|uniref:SDR family oxidoreductase n=1 Tax=unclassified Pseudomonas TaxID=196821 RepID=UPI000D3AFBE9|nr:MULTISPECIES: SDR family oxidoreductase [unclassified Pseudomonas]RAU44079.1 SDR family NAD(P)-dependent oxidoreductase [Pseudomonas sp. RIT 409]RAU54824.1 SDR family NAD(P)-dependent oxidoreductase [Pseudomonas sp. RIT 412]